MISLVPTLLWVFFLNFHPSHSLVVPPVNGRWKTFLVYVSDSDTRYTQQHLNVTGKFHGQCLQDKTVQKIQHFLSPSPFFVDLAANDAIPLSNTLSLERDAGWSGLCLEPNPRYWWALAHRKCTVIAAVVSDRPATVKFDFSKGTLGGIVGKRFDNKRSAAAERRATVPLRVVLQLAKANTIIDYLSLDVEGAELLVMQAFPFETYQISSLSVERPGDELQKILLRKGNLRFVRKHGTFGDFFFVNEKMSRFKDIVQTIITEVEEDCAMIVKPSNVPLDQCVTHLTNINSVNKELDKYVSSFYGYHDAKLHGVKNKRYLKYAAMYEK